MVAVAAVVVVLPAQHASVKVEGLWEAVVVVAAAGVGHPKHAQLSG